MALVNKDRPQDLGTGGHHTVYNVISLVIYGPSEQGQTTTLGDRTASHTLQNYSEDKLP